MFPAKSVVDTSSCVDEKIREFIFKQEAGVQRLSHHIFAHILCVCTWMQMPLLSLSVGL